jgi:tRNA acetyltransferase TAN1
MSVNENKRKRNFYVAASKKSKNQGQHIMKPGISGFLITCNFRERQALMEAYDLLNEAKERLDAADVDQAKDANAIQDVEDELKAELMQLKKDRSFYQVPTECKNTVFVKIVDGKWTSHQLLSDIWSNIEQSKSAKCRHICKFIPITEVIHSTESQIIKGVERLIKSQEPSTQTFKIEIRIRLHSGISKESLIQSIGELVKQNQPTWTVNLNEPNKMLYIDVLHKHTAISILDDFSKYRKYNLVEYAEKVTGIKLTPDLEPDFDTLKHEPNSEEVASESDLVKENLVQAALPQQ